jgi:mRNA interferase MazF
MVVRQGDVYWVHLRAPVGSEPGYQHPCIVVQNNLFNQSQIETVVLCTVTSNLKRASSPGNVLLAEREANLPQRSVVNVSQILTVDKAQLGEYIGTLSSRRVRQILDGIRLVLEPREAE